MTFEREMYLEPYRLTELDLTDWAYRILTEEYDRGLTGRRHADGTADLRPLPYLQRMSSRFAKGLRNQLPIKQGHDLNWGHAEMVEALDHACPDWRERVKEGRRLEPVEAP